MDKMKPKVKRFRTDVLFIEPTKQLLSSLNFDMKNQSAEGTNGMLSYSRDLAKEKLFSIQKLDPSKKKGSEELEERILELLKDLEDKIADYKPLVRTNNVTGGFVSVDPFLDVTYGHFIRHATLSAHATIKTSDTDPNPNLLELKLAIENKIKLIEDERKFCCSTGNQVRRTQIQEIETQLKTLLESLM